MEGSQTETVTVQDGEVVTAGDGRNYIVRQGGEFFEDAHTGVVLGRVGPVSPKIHLLMVAIGHRRRGNLRTSNLCIEYLYVGHPTYSVRALAGALSQSSCTSLRPPSHLHHCSSF
jgi:hypothetical protein